MSANTPYERSVDLFQEFFRSEGYAIKFEGYAGEYYEFHVATLSDRTATAKVLAIHNERLGDPPDLKREIENDFATKFRRSHGYTLEAYRPSAFV